MFAIFVAIIIFTYARFNVHSNTADANLNLYVTQEAGNVETAATNRTYKHNTQVVANTSLPLKNTECSYKENITIYMDSFMSLVKGFFGPEYNDFLVRSRNCKSLPGGGRCLFNYDNKHSDAILYYAIDKTLRYERFFGDQIVIMFTMEAESGLFCHLPTPDKYDMKISYRRGSTVPKPFFCENNLGQRVVEMGQPDVPSGNRKLAAGIIRNCVKWRADYLKELMKYIHIDQWGTCLKNTQGDFSKTRGRDFEKTKLGFLAQNPYKFLISFENIVDADYITEKIYHAYLSRSIPIFYGDKAVFDMVPGNSSLIYANDYSPKELAELIKRIDSNDTLYRQYFTNWDLSKMYKFHKQYCSEFFMCSICRKVWEKLYDRKCSITNL